MGWLVVVGTGAALPAVERAVKIEIVSTETYKRGVITEKMLREAFAIPKGAKIFIQVPGGGDYSNMDLDIEEIIVTWIEIT
jgi:hypothetical protein